jgi:ferredoxin-NADP reductase
MDVAISSAAFGFLALLAFYVTWLGVGHANRQSVARRTAVLEHNLLEARIGQIMDRRKFERARQELSWNGFRKFEIARKEKEGGGICSFYLSPHDRKPLPPFEPGQYLTFNLHIPNQPKAVVRCYSLSDSPNHPDYYRVSIKRLPPPRDNPDAPPGLSSSFFYDRLGQGDILDVKAPSGHFYLDRTKQGPVVLIGGGVGLTPVMSMLSDIVETDSQRETWFFYGVTNSDEHIMKDYFKQLDFENENVRVQVCYSGAHEQDKLGEDYHHGERVSVDLFKKVLPHNNYDFYICGPPPMMNSLVEGLEAWGVPRARIHFEAFGPATVKKLPIAESAIESSEGTAFKVTFARTGKVGNWTSAAGSLLEFAEEQGVAIDFGCRAGNCGTCVTAIKEGDVKYLNEPGDMPEAGSCLTCISVPKGNVVLDA